MHSPRHKNKGANLTNAPHQIPFFDNLTVRHITSAELTQPEKWASSPLDYTTLQLHNFQHHVKQRRCHEFINISLLRLDLNLICYDFGVFNWSKWRGSESREEIYYLELRRTTRLSIIIFKIWEGLCCACMINMQGFFYLFVQLRSIKSMAMPFISIPVVFFVFALWD